MSEPTSHTPHSDNPAAGSHVGSEGDPIMLELIREMGEQRRVLQEEQRLAAKERKAERRWKRLFQGLFFGGPLFIGILYFLFFLDTAGFRFGPWGSVVGVVHIEGEIAAGKPAGADQVIPALDKAFSDANVKAVVLSIDSPGGAPVEAERIYTEMAALKAKYAKPVVAVISNLGASAAYMIALHADKIVAGKYSIVGSIGAIMAGWRLDRTLAKVDVTQRVYASGPLKAFLNPFTPVSPEVDAKAKHLVEQMGQVFVQELKTTRGSKLKPGVDYGTGEPWGGLEAKELGLVDAIGTLDVATAGSEESEVRFAGIANPRRCLDILRARLKALA